MADLSQAKQLICSCSSKRMQLVCIEPANLVLQCLACGTILIHELNVVESRPKTEDSPKSYLG